MRIHVIVFVWWAALSAASIAAAQSGSSSGTETTAPSVDERLSAAESGIARLERIGITGYIQGRAVYQEDSRPLTNLFVRRARLNIRHNGSRSRMALSFDGGQGAVAVQDAYFDLILTPNRGQRQGLVVRAGQFFRPFGFEIERGEAEREFPERPAGWPYFFPGNRDLGADISAGITPSTILNLAVVNGNGTSSSATSFRDVDDHKDVLLRLRQTLFRPRIDLALSFYTGKQTIPGTEAVAAQTGYVDENGNGVREPEEPMVVIAPARAAREAIEGDRNRWGAALNAFDVLGGTLRAEYVGGEHLTTNLASGPTQAVATGHAYFAQYIRHVGADFSVGVRYDALDPDVDDEVRVRNDGFQETVGLLLMRMLGDNVRLSVAFEQPRVTVYDRTEQSVDHVEDPLWTFQGLYRF